MPSRLDSTRPYWLQAPLADELSLAPSAPEDARPWWRQAAERGWFALALPVAWGGRGGDRADLWALAERLGQAGVPAPAAVPGIFESLVVHHYFGRADAPEDVRRALLNGEALAAVATSEPEIGANPKHLATRAVRAGSGWQLSGTKAPVTHGLEASVFLVLAITGEQDGRRQFSVFAVPRNANGVSIESLSGPMAGHARVCFDGVEVPSSALIGAQGEALDALARPFRLQEQALLLAYALGVAERLGDVFAMQPGAEPARVGAAMAPVAALGAILAHLARTDAVDARFEAGLTGALEQLEAAQRLLLPELKGVVAAREPAAALQHMAFFLLRARSRAHDRLGRSLIRQNQHTGSVNA
ncbi:MAG TPA: acyl-CoA dehydrogenase family protein [Candidatus Acidoferrales bacterium]|nr:acyl-CoA dehydrogenase family protein [Candidatus Acidoferrales bacterium]